MYDKLMHINRMYEEYDKPMHKDIYGKLVRTKRIYEEYDKLMHIETSCEDNRLFTRTCTVSLFVLKGFMKSTVSLCVLNGCTKRAAWEQGHVR